MLKLENIYGGYTANHSILNGINLTIAPNKTLALIGQNGAGKSTLAKAILGMLPHCSGSIVFNGKNLSEKSTVEIVNQGIAYFMQGGRIFPHLTVKENLALAAWDQKRSVYSKNLKRIKQYFEFLNNKNKENLKTSYLSGGEKHQLAMAMVLVNSPQFLILDEPSAGLSPKNTESIYAILSQILKEEGITILLIEQNVEKAVAFSNKVALLKNGKIIKILDSNNTKIHEEIDEFYFE